MRIKGKICVVTGGASGIGEATARAFAEAGATCARAYGPVSRIGRFPSISQFRPRFSVFPNLVVQAL